MKTTFVRATTKGWAAPGWFLFLLLCLTVCGNGFAQVFDPLAEPMISISSPANHAVFFGPADIPIFARVVDASHTTNVEFFAGTNDLGPGVNLGSAPRVVGPVMPIVLGGDLRLASVYCLVWSNAPAGSNRLTVVNTGTNRLLGVEKYLSRTSAPVNVTVIASTAPTNGPDVVSVVATDPVAVSGTNSWVWRDMTNVTPTWTNWPPHIWQFYTNWGPKNALFTVRRFGDAIAPVTVSYSLSGTATNGTNYGALAGTVTMPAGAAYALIPVVPIDNGPPYIPKTVILTLNPDTNATPAYHVGIPRRAAAVIVHDWVRSYLPFLLADGSFHLNADGPDGAWFSVQNSTDLLRWSTVSTNQVFQGSIDFVDMDAVSNVVRFYQAVAQPGAPTQ